MEKNTYRYVILTGVPGIGKTTLIKKVCEMLQKKGIPLMGFFTNEVKEGGKRIGFDVVSLSGKKAPLARISSSDGSHYPKVGRYNVYIESFDNLCLPEIPDLPISEQKLLILDEIGKMELLSFNFQKKIKQYFMGENLQTILGTVPFSSKQCRNASDSVIQMIKSHKGTLLLTVTPENRNDLTEIIVHHICEAFENRK